MKKKLIVWLFLVLIACTAITCIVSAIESYRFDMDPNNGVDILEGFGAFLIVIVGGFVILYEIDLFYTVYYFFVMPKKKVKTILNILANLCLLLAFVYIRLSDVYMELRAFEITPSVLFFMYVALRLAYCAVSLYLWEKQSS